MNQPIFTGHAILEESKILMYDFHYNTIKKNFPDSSLLFTDTDSLCYHFKEENILENPDVKKVMDFSNYKKDHPLFDESVKKVPGYFKNESPHNNIIKFTGLRSKCYSYETDDPEDNCNKAKGISQTAVKNTFNYEMYDKALKGMKSFAKCSSFVQKNNQIMTIETNKMALNSFDDKRYLRDDGINSFPYGHYKIRKERQLAKKNFIEEYY